MTVVLLADRRQSRTAQMLKGAGYRVVTTFTPDHAVAICVNNKVDAVILDQDHFLVTEGWSVAQSLKMIGRTMCIILVVRGRRIGDDMPKGIDAIVAEEDRTDLLDTLGRLLAA
jgi:PleD family two-component response regulator